MSTESKIKAVTAIWVVLALGFFGTAVKRYFCGGEEAVLVICGWFALVIARMVYKSEHYAQEILELRSSYGCARMKVDMLEDKIERLEREQQ